MPETAAGDFTSQSIAGSSFSVADNFFQFAATAYQVAGDVLQLEINCSNPIQDQRLSFPISRSSLRSFNFPIPVRTAFAGRRGLMGESFAPTGFELTIVAAM